MHKLTTQTLPVLTYLKNWDKLFESPFKSDVYFFSTRLQTGRKWGTPQAITVRDADFGMVRLRAFGMYSYGIADAKKFFTGISGTRAVYTRDDLEEQLRGILVSTMATALGASPKPFLDMAANQTLMANEVKGAIEAAFQKYGLALDVFNVTSINLPEDLQEALDKRIAIGMSGDLNKYTQYQVANAVPLAAQNEGGIAGVGAGISAGVVLGQTMAQGLAAAQKGAAAAGEAPATAPAPDPEARLGQLKNLLDKGLISATDFESAKTEVLKKLVG
jgi:membrane protease subunit (stomatin/prohibitin family)